MEENPRLKYDILIQKDYAQTAVSMVRSSKNRIAFFCSSDVYALELSNSFREQGIAVPSEAGIMGFDNLDILSYISPRLTTVSTSVEGVGREAMKRLVMLMNGEQVADNYFIPHIICPGETL
jgi:LacI family transcriptional regulator